MLILLAAEPEFSETQLSRALIAAEAEHIKPLIVLNKSDLGQAFQQAWQRLAAYRHMGYEVLPLELKSPQDANTSLRELRSQMEGKTTLILGPSGAGKSTLVNALVPNARALTGEISQALNSGKHTTTSTSLYWVGNRPDLSSGNAGYRHHRFAGFSRVWPSAHSTESIGFLYARFEATYSQLQVLQLHPFA